MNPHGRRVALVFAATTLLGCGSDPTGPNPLLAVGEREIIQPAVSYISAEFESSGRAILIDTSIPIDGVEQHHRIEVIVRTSSGSSARVLLGPTVCHQFVLCQLVKIEVRRPSDLERIDPLIHALPGYRAGSARLCNQLGECSDADARETIVRLFDPDLYEAIQTVRRWSGVASAENLATIPMIHSERTTMGMSGGILVESDEIPTDVPSIPVTPSDTITVEYHRPDGSIVLDTIEP